LGGIVLHAQFDSVNTTSPTVSFTPDLRTPAESKAEGIGADELLNRADWALREDPRLLFKLKRRYRDLCRLLYHAIGGSK
jgi:hypothetical protein